MGKLGLVIVYVEICETYLYYDRNLKIKKRNKQVAPNLLISFQITIVMN